MLSIFYLEAWYNQNHQFTKAQMENFPCAEGRKSYSVGNFMTLGDLQLSFNGWRPLTSYVFQLKFLDDFLRFLEAPFMLSKAYFCMHVWAF